MIRQGRTYALLAAVLALLSGADAQVAHNLRVRVPNDPGFIYLCEIDLFLPDGTNVPLTFTSLTAPNTAGTLALDGNTGTCAQSLSATEPQWSASYSTPDAEAKGTVRVFNLASGPEITKQRMDGAEIFLDSEIIGTLVYDVDNVLQEYNFSKIPTTAPTRSPGYVRTRAPTTATPTFAPLEPPQFFAEDSFVALAVGAVVALGSLAFILYLRRRSGGPGYASAGSMGGMGGPPGLGGDTRAGKPPKPIMAVPKTKAEIAAEKEKRKAANRGPPPAVRAAMEAREAAPERPAAPPAQHGNIRAPRTRGFLKGADLGL